jgi:Tol biopolymer transport system component
VSACLAVLIRAVLFALVFGLAASTPGAAAPLTQNGLIAFASDRSENLEKSEVYIVGADGKNRMNVSRGTTTPEDEDPHPTWSPDSRRLAFSGDEALVVVAADGSSRELWNEGDLRDTHDRPNWSPDGRDIAVAGVSLVSTSTHRVRHLTSGGIADGEAMWSHDGTRLAFLRFEVEGDFPALYVIRRDGTGLRRLARRVTCRVSWSPTGYSLLFGDQTGALIIIDARTGRRRHLSLGRRQVASDVDAVWAPRGKWIAVPTGRGLYLVTPNGRERRRISSLVGTPAWSPTGKAVAVPSRGDIYVISVETGRRRRVVRGRCREEVTGMSWAADGEHIAFVSSMSGENDTEIFKMRDDGSRLNRLTHNCSRYEREPAWSPNGRRIAYAMDDIFVMRADGSHKARLTRGKALDSSPSWSPEGGTIVFSRFVVRRGGSQLFIVGTGSKRKPRMLTGWPGSNADPAWAPRGGRIAFVSTRQGRSPQIYVMRDDGTGATAITAGPDSASEPAWSSDGTRLAFVRDFDIWTMNADGTNPVRLTRSSGYTEAAHPAWSPDGTRIVFARDIDYGRGTQYALFVIPSSGGEPEPLASAYGNDEDPDWQPLP